EFRIGERRAAMPGQNLAKFLRNNFIERLQDQISPSMCPKLILVPTARVTLRPGETSLISPWRLVVDQVPSERFFNPQTEGSEGCRVTAATAREKSYFFSSSTWCAKSCVS